MSALARMGPAGRAEANRLVLHSAKPASQNWKPYQCPPQIYQNDIRKYMKQIQKEPDRSED